MEDPEIFPTIEECIRFIAETTGAPVSKVAAALLLQSEEHNMSAEELVHTQYKTALEGAEESRARKGRGGTHPYLNHERHH